MTAEPGVEAVVAFIRTLRPEWAPQAIVAALKHNESVPWQRRLVALLRVSLDPDTIAPGRLREAGPWWVEPGDATPVPPNLRRDPVCREHMKRLPCIGCAADAKAVRDAELEPEGVSP